MILAVDMGGTRWKAAVMDRGRVVVFDSLPHSSSVNSLTDLASLFERMLESAGCSLSDVLGLGISLPEIVDADAKFCPSPCFKHPYLEGKNVEDVVRQFINLPVFVDNDARAALLGEEAYGVLRNAASDNVMAVTLGTGIGVAARVNGVMVRGAHATGGTLGGHITLDLNGPECMCGNRGCAEVLASGWALNGPLRETEWLRNSTLAGANKLGFKDLVDAAAGGDPHARAGLDHFVAVWTSLLVSLIHCFDPEHIVLSGGFVHSAEHFEAPLTAAVRERIWDRNNMPHLKISEAPDYSGLLGCEAMVRAALDAPFH